ncbi:sensor domain-containing diguanylate cyclase [uncultured Pseudoteredinibacter sp.]|uniref:sensor domain-containing diguanylate cyclase n=1 Tax=uncultured Pseudoteredinibacter sp. TaxID=1641701 RepID=UPI002631C9C2|nr:sensor domain-containing diguanylate cyclase [uncultured Pseudoteredinibacter sp.]
MNLEQENKRLQGTVKLLLRRIEQNHGIQQHFHAFEFKLLACQCLRDLLDLLLVEAQRHFNLSAVSLVIIDSDYSIRELMEQLDLTDYGSCLQMRNGVDFLATLYPQQSEVTLGDMDVLTAGRIFPGSGRVVSSACMPLVRQDKLVGSLHFASDSTERFQPDMATDFLSHLASIVSLCLENCIGREHLSRQGKVDMLTQVNNRRSFEAELERELERAQRNQEPLSCMFVDVDHFKQINDQFGHQAGDLVLKHLAYEVSLQLRKTDFLARYGGEEFVVLAPRCPQAHAERLAERIRVAVEEMAIDVCGSKKVRPTVSVGLATWCPKQQGRCDLQLVGHGLLASADEVMYQAKRGGRNQVLSQRYELLQPSASSNEVDSASAKASR